MSKINHLFILFSLFSCLALVLCYSIMSVQSSAPPSSTKPFATQQQSAADLADQQLVNNFEVPSWAGKPPAGLHLDCLKEGKLIQKLMIDEKKCYFFGRNRQLCDFPIEHASSSRVHAALVWHKALCRPFLIDLGSTHGTFLGEHVRLEPSKPQQIPPECQIHFGASQRIYVVRERPFTAALTSAVTSGSSVSSGALKPAGSSASAFANAALELPEDETELDNLTEYNTAHNRRIASLPINDQSKVNAMKRPRRKFKTLTFCEEEQIINPEDVDPNVGRFRNLCRTVVVPSKRPRMGPGGPLSSPTSQTGVQFFGPGASALPQKVAAEEEHESRSSHPDKSPTSSSALSVLQNPLYSSAKLLNIALPNLAPSLDEPQPVKPVVPTTVPALVVRADAVGDYGDQLYSGIEDEPTDPTNVHGDVKRKKYAKEAWPGKKPTGALLV